MATTKATIKQSTSLLKKFLKEKFNTNASVRSDFYSGGSSLNVSYKLGLKTENIENELNRLQSGNFNGMIDMYEFKKNAETGMVLNGYEIQNYKYVFVKREISDEFILKIAQAFFTTFKFSEVQTPETIKDLHESKYINILGCWSISNYLFQFINKMNFLTNDESQISKMWFENQNLNTFDGAVMHYELNGEVFTTNDAIIKKQTKEVVKEKTINLNNIRLVDYSEKAIAVIGDTYEIKDQLKELGGKFNKFLTVEGEKVAGWIFSKRSENEVANLLIDYSQQ